MKKRRLETEDAARALARLDREDEDERDSQAHSKTDARRNELQGRLETG